MATKQAKKVPSSPVALTQEQVDMARKGYSRTVFERIEKSGTAMKSKGKSRSRRKA
jgi:hypothetical protein